MQGIHDPLGDVGRALDVEPVAGDVDRIDAGARGGESPRVIVADVGNRSSRALE